MERLDTLVEAILQEARRRMDKRAALSSRRPESPGCDVAPAKVRRFVVTRQGGERTQTGAPGRQAE